MLRECRGSYLTVKFAYGAGDEYRKELLKSRIGDGRTNRAIEVSEKNSESICNCR